MAPSLRTQRLRLTWLLALPFLYFARPSSTSLIGGILLALPGVTVRVIASGHIDKDRELATAGPYGYLRHPLYVGSFLVGTGLAVAGGRWLFLPVFLGVFAWVYGRTVRAEGVELGRRFGASYEEYRTRVPAFLPRFRRGGRWGFHPRLFRQNKEWEAVAGIAAAFGLLWLKMAWSG